MKESRACKTFLLLYIDYTNKKYYFYFNCIGFTKCSYKSGIFFSIKNSINCKCLDKPGKAKKILINKNNNKIKKNIINKHLSFLVFQTLFK